MDYILLTVTILITCYGNVILDWVFGWFKLGWASATLMGVLWLGAILILQILFPLDFYPNGWQIVSVGLVALPLFTLSDYLKWRRGWGFHPARPIWRQYTHKET